MRERSFFFEIRDNVGLFLSAFDDVVIGRFNKSREELDKIEVRYVYAPKQRVIHDLNNPQKALELPVVAVHIDGWNRDPDRVFNKIHGFNFPVRRADGELTSNFRSPIPIDIRINMSLLARYQTDIEQMIQNFAVFCNPYIVVAWQIPEAYDLSPVQEIRSHIIWDGDIKYDFSLVDSDAQDKSRFVAETTFTIKGWLFPANKDNPVGNIHYVTANFYNTKVLSGTGYTYDDNYKYLSGGPYEYLDGTTTITEVETVGVSGYPQITDVFHSLSGRGRVAIIDSDLEFPAGNAGDVVILYGKRFEYTENVYLSSYDTTLYGTVTGVGTSSRFPTFSGAPLPLSAIDIVTGNVMRVTIPTLTASSNFTLIVQSDIGWASTYSAMSGHFKKIV